VTTPTSYRVWCSTSAYLHGRAYVGTVSGSFLSSLPSAYISTSPQHLLGWFHFTVNKALASSSCCLDPNTPHIHNNFHHSAVDQHSRATLPSFAMYHREPPSSSSEHRDPLLDSARSSQEFELSHLHHSNERPSLLLGSGGAAQKGTPKLFIAGALVIAIAGFVIQTEAVAYYEDVLGWKKPFCSLYIMHSCLALPWFLHLAYLRIKELDKPYTLWVRDYNNELRACVSTVEAFAVSGPSIVIKRAGSLGGPLDYLATTMGIVTLVLTVSGCSWFMALEFTTPSDLTAIYNCSTFFAAAFSVPILRQKVGRIGLIAVALSIMGTFTIAYGDTTAHASDDANDPPAVGASRLFGNVIALIGAVAFGLYEVLFKKWACPSHAVRPSSSLNLTLAASALTGIYTFSFFWIVLVVMHFIGVEPFVLPSLHVLSYVILSITAGSSKSFSSSIKALSS
jgi:drug/metabolite transporter (DMT)-like permease